LGIAHAEDSTVDPAPVQASNEEVKDLFNLSYYEPLYFLVGNPVSLAQLSFKYQAVRTLPVYLAYDQRLFWKLWANSRPIVDINYNPRILYRLNPDKADDDKFIDLIPFEHHSNGKDSADSRSYNSIGAKISWHFESENWSLKPWFKAQKRYNFDDTNNDIDKFVGPFETGFSISRFSPGWFNKCELTYRVYTGGNWGQNLARTSQEIGFSFRIFGEKLTPAIYLQYFDGYMESLYYYNKRQKNFRAGILL